MVTNKKISEIRTQIAKGLLDLRSHRVKDTNVVKKLRQQLAKLLTEENKK